jgi:hypothetical protein
VTLPRGRRNEWVEKSAAPGGRGVERLQVRWCGDVCEDGGKERFCCEFCVARAGMSMTFPSEELVNVLDHV